MSGLETAIFAALWLVLALLATLVLILYRQLDRAYRRSAAADATLAPGSEAPEIQVLRPDGSYAVIDPSEHAERLVFAFVRTGCDSCAQLLRELAQNGLPEQTFALVNGEGFNEYAHSKSDRFEALWLAHPPDVVRSYGVTAVPLVYVVHRGRVLAAKATATRKGVEALLADADLIEQELAREAAGNGSTPVAAGEP